MRIVKVAPMWRLKVLVQWKLNMAGVFERPFWGGISVAQIERSSEHDRGSTHHFHQNLSAKWLYLDLV